MFGSASHRHHTQRPMKIKEKNACCRVSTPKNRKYFHRNEADSLKIENYVINIEWYLCVEPFIIQGFQRKGTRSKQMISFDNRIIFSFPPPQSPQAGLKVINILIIHSP